MYWGMRSIEFFKAPSSSLSRIRSDLKAITPWCTPTKGHQTWIQLHKKKTSTILTSNRQNQNYIIKLNRRPKLEICDLCNSPPIIGPVLGPSCRWSFPLHHLVSKFLFETSDLISHQLPSHKTLPFEPRFTLPRVIFLFSKIIAYSRQSWSQ